MLKKKPRIGIDCDGVLADFLTPTFLVIEELFGIRLTADQLQTWDLDGVIPGRADELWAHLGKDNFHSQLLPYPGAVEGIQALHEVADIYIVTSYLHSSPTWVYDRDAWLYKHFNIPGRKCVHTKAKYTFFGKMLIDDKPSNIDEWIAEHPSGVGILWAHSYNRDRTDLLRMNSWDDVIQTVKML